MLSFNILFWVLPLFLIIIFVYRLVVKPTNKELLNQPVSQKQKSGKFGLKFIIALILIAVLYFGIKNLPASLFSPSCPTEFSPKELAEMANKTEDDKAGILRDHDFHSEEEKIKDENGNMLITHKYADKVGLYGTIRWTEVDEYVITFEKNRIWFEYVLKNRKQYDNFFYYLKKIGGVEYPIDSVSKNYKDVSREYYKFNNGIFVKSGFQKMRDGFVIYIANCDSIKLHE